MECKGHYWQKGVCAVCGATADCATTECPKTQMTDKEREQVEEDKLDFVGGRWVRCKS